MILVDSSVWVDYFNGKQTPLTKLLRYHLLNQKAVIADLILTEVLKGFRHDKDYETAKTALSILPILTIGGEYISVKAADNYRRLRKKGVTVRGTVDMIIATYAIENHFELLYADRDFDMMVKHLGLRSAARRK